jgi:hypothetical protein
MWSSIVGLLGGLVPGSGDLKLIDGVLVSLFNYRMWRSLGWLLLGIMLAVMGFVIWNRKAIGGAVKDAATVAAVA